MKMHMNNKGIAEIFEAIKSHDIEDKKKLWEIANMEGEFNMINYVWFYRQILESIYKQILDGGDDEYFFCYLKDYDVEARELATSDYPYEKIIKLWEKNDPNGRKRRAERREIVASIIGYARDKTKIDELIDRKEELGLPDAIISKMINLTDDKEYIRKKTEEKSAHIGL